MQPNAATLYSIDRGRSDKTQHVSVFFPLPPFYFLRPFLPLVEPPALELVDATLDAREGAAELFLLDFTDLTLSSALFYTLPR